MALLPKISNALAKFVTPVNQTAAQTRTGTQPQLHQKPASKKPDLKLVPPVSRESEETHSDPKEQKREGSFERFSSPQAKKPELAVVASQDGNPGEPGVLGASSQENPEKSVAAKLLDIFRSFQDGKQNITRLSGSRVYKEMTKDEQKGKFRRGAMLDEKIE